MLRTIFGAVVSLVLLSGSSAAQSAPSGPYPWNMPAPAKRALKQILPADSAPWMRDLNGVASEYLQIQTGSGETYLTGNVCKPRDCHDNMIAYVVASSGARAAAKLVLNDTNFQTFGAPIAAEISILDKQLLEWRALGNWPTPAEQRSILQGILDQHPRPTEKP